MLVKVAEKSPLWFEPKVGHEKLFYVELPPSKKLVILDRDFKEIHIPEVKLQRLFEWRGLLHIKHKTFFDTNALQVVEKEFKCLDAVPGNISFVVQNPDTAIFKIVNEEAQEVRWFMLSKEDEVTALESVKSDHIYFNEEQVIFLTKEALSSFCLKTKTITWQISFGELFPDHNFEHLWQYVVHGGKVFMYFVYKNSDNPARSVTICWDARSGKLLKRIEGYGGHLLLCEDKIYTAGDHTIRILNTHTLEFTELNMAAQLALHKLDIYSYESVVTEDGLLYFVEGSVMATNYFGIIDLKTQKLLWHGSVNVTDRHLKSIQSLQVRGNYVYLFTSDKTLHVFKRE